MARVTTKTTKKQTSSLNKAKPAKGKAAVAPKGKKAAASAPKKNTAAKTAKPAKAVKAPKKVQEKKTAVAMKKVQTSKTPVAAQKAQAAPAKKKKLSPREEAIQRIRLTLVRQRSTLLNEAESALNELPGQTIFPDLGDQASAETDRNFMLRLRGREQRLLKKIDEAIERIDSGTFGICDDCGNEIEVKRLEVRPVTNMCIECKTLQEEEEKLRES